MEARDVRAYDAHIDGTGAHLTPKRASRSSCRDARRSPVETGAVKPGSARKATVVCTRFDCQGRPSEVHLFEAGAAASFLSALFHGGRLGIESYQFVCFGGGSLKGSSKLLSCSDESSITPDPSSSSVEMAAAI